VPRFVRDNGLSLAFGTIFLATLVGQAISGADTFNHGQALHNGDPISFWHYVTSAAFWADVMENWQSEYLQFTLYIFATIWLIQRGSNESKKPDEAGLESDEEQLLGAHAKPDSPRWAKAGGWRTRVFSNSLLLVMGTIWVASWLAQSLAGRIVYNADQLDHQAGTVSWATYVTTADFWNRTLQNWQSEFLAVGSMVILSVFLRQRGSPESKPVGAAHADTASSG
jgi:membrane protein implicated in regulation of membrane protease activity